MTRSRRSRRRRLRRRLGAHLTTRTRWAATDDARSEFAPEEAAEEETGEPGGTTRFPAFELVDPEADEKEPDPIGRPLLEPDVSARAMTHDIGRTVDLLYRAAREAGARGESGRAVGIYRELLDRAPHHVGARNNLALLLDQLGDPVGALTELEQCLAVEPDNPQVLVNRGAVLGAGGHYAAAESDLRRVVQMEPGNAEAYFNLGLVISRKGLWREAIPHLRRAIELDSSRAQAYFYLGEALNHVDDLEGALQCYQRAIELRPNNPKALYGLGIVLDRMNRPEEAAQMYRRSRELAGR